MVEQEGHGVREDFAHQPTCQMPEVARPHLLYAIALCELAENGIYPVAKPTEESALFRRRVSLLGGIRGQKLNTHTRQLLLGLGRVVVAISDEKARGGLDKLGDYRELVGVGRSYRDAADHPRPADPYVHPEAVEGLLEEGVLAESGLSFEARAAMGSGEQAHWQGHRVADGEGRVVRNADEELSPEEFLDLPQVRCLPGEGGAMHLPEVREEVGVVAPEVRKELGVFVEPEELTDDLDSQYFRVTERGSGSAFSEAPVALETVIYEAEDRDDEGAKIHRKTSAASGAIGSTPSVGVSSVLLKSSKKLAHGVSYRVGTRLRVEEKDVRALLFMLVNDGERWRTLRGLVPHRGTSHAVFSLRDPMPSLTSLAKLLVWSRQHYRDSRSLPMRRALAAAKQPSRVR